MTPYSPADGERRKPRRTRGIVLRIGGVCLLALALMCGYVTVNAVAYLMGFGQPVTVTVAESSTYWGRTDIVSESNGIGYYDKDGELVRAHMAYVNEGDVVKTRLPVLPTELGSGSLVMSGDKAALMSLGEFGAGTLVTAVGGVLLVRLAGKRAARSRAYYDEPMADKGWTREPERPSDP